MKQGGAVSELNLTFKDPANETNFYEVEVANSYLVNVDPLFGYYSLTTQDEIITSESYYPSLLNFDKDKPRYLLFKDKKINGQEHTLTFYYIPPQHEDSHRYISSHYIIVYLRSVTEEYYKFKTTMIQQKYARAEDILYGAAEPINVFTNIQNGYGIFAGFNNDMVPMYINEIKLP